MKLIPAFRKDQALLQDIKAYQGQHTLRIWWLGQSGFLLHDGQNQVLLDPYLSDSLTIKYAQTDKPHVRMSERVIDPAALRDISIVTSSHNHTDHLDADTLIPLIKSNPTIQMVIPEANRSFVSQRTGKPSDFPIGLKDGQSIQIGEIIFHGIAAAHNTIERDEQGNCRFMGYVITIGGKNIYHSGDTLHFHGMEDLLRPFQIDVALLPINGNDPARGVAGNLSIDETIALSKTCGFGLTIPCHYDMFSFNTADPKAFAEKADAAGIPYLVLRHGESCIVE